MREDLPSAARTRPDWPIRLDHCFARVILDAVCGRPWREVLAAPAWRHLPPDRLEAAIGLADAILAGDADLDALNRASLEARRARGAEMIAHAGETCGARFDLIAPPEPAGDVPPGAGL